MRKATQALIAVIAVALLTGCSHGVRDKWLRVLFDEPPTVTGEPAGVIGEAPADSSGGLVESKPLTGAIHAPYSSGACGVCHNLDDSHSFPGGGGWPQREPPAKRAAASRDPGAAAASRLRLPPDRLCGGCHDDLDAPALAATRSLVHGPVAMGDCLVCHDPHKSDNRHLMRKSPVSDLCHGCHDPQETALLHPDGRDSETTCTTCHDPHASDRPHLLLEDRP